MINTIQIPKPCHQDWNTMTANDQGRHCLQCCKTVVDFTNKEPEEIVKYLKDHSGQRVCGRFTSTQINTPIVITEEITFHILSSSLSYFKKIAALILITFGMLVTSSDKGFSQPSSAPRSIDTSKHDSTIHPMVVGRLEYMPAHPTHKRVVKKKKNKKKICHKIANNPPFLQGDVEVVPLMGAVQMKPDSSQ